MTRGRCLEEELTRAMATEGDALVPNGLLTLAVEALGKKNTALRVVGMALAPTCRGFDSERLLVTVNAALDDTRRSTSTTAAASPAPSGANFAVPTEEPRPSPCSPWAEQLMAAISAVLSARASLLMAANLAHKAGRFELQATFMDRWSKLCDQTRALEGLCATLEVAS